MARPWSSRLLWLPKQDWDKTVSGQIDAVALQLHELAHVVLGVLPPILRARLEQLHAASFRHRGETARARAARRWGS